MARSDYVYIITADGQPPIAWTVKHELRTWLAGLPSVPGDWRLWRVRNGRPQDAMTTMSFRDVIEGR